MTTTDRHELSPFAREKLGDSIEHRAADPDSLKHRQRYQSRDAKAATMKVIEHGGQCSWLTIDGS